MPAAWLGRQLENVHLMKASAESTTLWLRRGGPNLPLISLIMAIILTAAVYYPGLYGGFILDDGPHIRNNPSIAIHDLEVASLKQAFFASKASFPQNRPVSMLSFGLNHYASGLEPYYFKLTNLLIHLLGGLVLFLLIERMIVLYSAVDERGLSRARIRWLALAVAAPGC